jgi:Phage antitermination protein Q
MSTETDYLLVQWGVWQRSRPNTECVSSLLIVMQLAQSAKASSCQITDDDALWVDSAVAKLKMRDSYLFNLLWLRYVYGLSLREMVEQLNKSRRRCDLAGLNRQLVDKQLTGAVAWIDSALNFMDDEKYRLRVAAK